MHQYRTHTCGALRQSDVDAEVRLSGWVHRKRDHGNLLFVDLRDHYGLTQIVVDTSHEVFPILEGLSNESTVCVTGKVLKRSDETINPNMETGEIEVVAEKVEVLSRSDQLPMPVNKDAGYPEDIRLKNRFLDLRREDMQKNIILRSEVISSVRRRMIDQGFREYQTPILTASSPEGARDFLVPSRLHPGKFYALPQAPQQFKQLLMMAGFDRYFQIAPCFRDEDARADRSPGEFYQLDFEMSFVTQEDVFDAIEPVLHDLFVEFADGREVSPMPFKRIPYKESMEKYGNDKPDLRNPLIITNVSDVFAGSDFKVFAGLVEKGMVVKAIPAPKVSDRPRSFFDKLNSWAQSEGQAGLGYINFKEEGPAGPIAKNLDEARLEKIKEITGVKDGDAVFFVAGKEKDAADFAGIVRTKLGNDLELIDENKFDFCWIVDFPMFEYDEKLGKVDFSHNPFSMPQGGMDALENQDPLTINAYQYDIVCNGIELSSGAIRNHLPEVMYKAFEIAGYGPEVVDERFGGMINALKLGAPPHGGSAPGIDRIVMLLAGTENIREVTAFPMNQMAQDLMMGAPAAVDDHQLEDVHIKIQMPVEALDN
ncbi:aspartate--tRNA ligase [Curvivirga aplysinae]|uniref:aspartate--tRNA ligase n=1 Tax=Curvivirga aplysinae TaxID=2529852 RepID=UPI0012BC92E7|nr:aspartate--tRNA ligase [Curvivirga aplysinae]MTI10527.1 aspartate--tRNA ligase [Curvivirga aplysinae]